MRRLTRRCNRRPGNGIRCSPFQAASRTLPTPFRPPSETCLPIPSKLLPRPFRPPSKTCSPPPYTPRARNRAGSLEASSPGSGLEGWKPENSSAVSEDRKDTGGTRPLALAKSRKRIARSGGLQTPDTLAPLQCQPDPA
jgi:hypothetical protein